MEVFFDCLPCLLRQALEAARMTSSSPDLHDRIMTDSIEILSKYRQYKNSPDIARAIHKVIKVHTNNDDPYYKIKERDLKAANRLYPIIKEYYEINKDLLTALKISAIGNTIDSALNNHLSLENCLEKELEKTLEVCDIDSLEQKLIGAEEVLIIGDNTGETIFDKFLIEKINDLGIKEINYAVRSEPIINDATFVEAYESGLDQFASIISSGCNAPGTILQECNKTFLDKFNNSDIVISKGQGNFEALSDEKGIFFLLKAKCPMIAKKLQVELNEYVLIYSGD